MPQTVPGRQLDIRVTRIHNKNPLASLLIGDTSTASGVARVAGGPTQKIVYIDASGAMVNGIVGAAIAIGSNKGKIDAKLAAGLAKAAVASANGQKGTPDFAKENWRMATTGSNAAPDQAPQNWYCDTTYNSNELISRT